MQRISGAPVVEQPQGRLLGIISIQDLIKRWRTTADDLVGEHMTHTVVTVRTDDRAVKAINLFAQYGYGRLPVVDEAGNLVGIVTASDIARAAAHPESPLPGGRNAPLPGQSHLR